MARQPVFRADGCPFSASVPCQRLCSAFAGGAFGCTKTGMKAPRCAISRPRLPIATARLVSPGASQDRASGGGSGPVPLRRRPGPAIPLTRFGQGTGTGLPPHPDSVPAPAVSRPAPWPVSRPELTSVHHQPGCLLFPPGTGGRCLATAPWRRPGPAVLVLCVYEERARLTPTTFLGFSGEFCGGLSRPQAKGRFRR